MSLHSAHLSAIVPPSKAKNKDPPTTAAVTHNATAQKSHCVCGISLISLTFIPKKDETKFRGRKIIVTTVKTRMALP